MPIILLALTIFLSFLSTTIISQNLVLLLVISYSINFPAVNSYFFAFLSGLFFDLIKGERIGATSIIFLLISFIISLYKAKFYQQHFLYSFFFTFFVFCFLNHLSFKNIFLVKSLFLAILVVPLNLIIFLLKEKLEKGNQPKLEI